MTTITHICNTSLQSGDIVVIMGRRAKILLVETGHLSIRPYPMPRDWLIEVLLGVVRRLQDLIAWLDWRGFR
jgi:hypothetical protein